MHSKSLTSLIIALMCLLVGANTSEAKGNEISAGEHTRVNTKYCQIEGYKDGDIFTFKGIPYAEAKRFMPPHAPEYCSDLRMRKLYGPQAPQDENLIWGGKDQNDYEFGNQFVIERMDEEGCLVLNVWTPEINGEKQRPVFVWIHGGGFHAGSGHDLPCYEGRALAEKGDIVVVNLNHRLNILGYSDMRPLGEEYSNSVNLGQQDIVKALEWIHDNISLFGGDPNNVTIGGQSGGGAKVSTLMAMPSAQGLFHKAIVQSGSSLRQGESDKSTQYTAEILTELGVDSQNPQKINDFNYEELIRASSKAAATLNARSGITTGRGGYSFSPVVDGVVLPTHPFDPVAPEISRDIPMLIGTNFNEFTFDIDINPSSEEILETLQSRYGERTEEFIAAFHQSFPNAQDKDMLYMDLWFRPTAVKQAQIKSEQNGAPAYLYMFNWRPKNNSLGASHGMELPFMFNNVELQREMTGSTEEAYRLEDLISNVWIQFIKTDNPNVEGLPYWQPYNKEDGATMVFDNECYVAKHLDDKLIEIAQGGR